MDSHTAHHVQDACRRLLRPVVRFLLRCGVTWKDFAEIAKWVYVDVACSEYGIRGRPTNTSRVAILTGLNRRQVKDLRDQLAVKTELPTGGAPMQPTTRILAAWHQDAEFQDDNGKPLELPREGDGRSFTALIKRYCGDLPASALAKELIRVGAVSETAGDRLKVLRRSYIPVEFSNEAIHMLGTHIQDLAETVEFNLGRDSTSMRRFQRVASNEHIPLHAADAFNALLAREGQIFLERLDDWLTEHAVDKDSREETKRVGAGLYFFHG